MQIHIFQIITCRRRNNVFFAALSVIAILSSNTATHKCDFSGWTCGVDSNKNRTKTFTWPKRQLNTKIQCADIIWLLTFPWFGGRPKILVGCSNWYRQLALVDMDKPLSPWKRYLDLFTAVCWACHAGVFFGQICRYPSYMFVAWLWKNTHTTGRIAVIVICDTAAFLF